MNLQNYEFSRTPDGRLWAKPKRLASVASLAALAFADDDDDKDFVLGDDDWDDDDDWDLDGDDMILGDDMVLGDDDMILGDDDDDDWDEYLLGADKKIARSGLTSASALVKRQAMALARKMARAHKNKLAKKIARARATGGFVVGNKKVAGGMSLMTPFNQVFTASQTANVNIIPTRNTKIEDFIVAGLNAATFQLNTFTNGADNLFNAGGGMNMNVFNPGAVRRQPIKGFTATAGVPIILNVTNLDAVNSQTLSGMIVGQTVIKVG